MLENDSLALNIYSHLLDAYHESARTYGPFGNLVGLFFHDLMIHFTAIVEQRVRNDSEICEDLNFPFVSVSYADQPVQLGKDKLSIIPDVQNRLTPFTALTGLVPVTQGDAVAFGFGQDTVTRYLYRMLLCQAPFEQAYIPKLSQQLELLVDTITKICAEIVIANPEIITKNWIDYIEERTTSKQRIVKQKGIVLGTRGKLINRIHAINYMQQNKKVVGFTHGEINNSLFDEPIIGYSETTLCTTLVDYGNSISSGSYNSPLIEPVKRISRKSSIIYQIYEPDQKIADIPKKKPKILYVPTLFTGCQVYGPFRQLLDNDYYDWQQKLIKALEAIFGSITVKQHPKNKITYPHDAAIDTRRLESCISEYDLLVLDYYSTAATVSIATDKPIMYFDIGLRNMNSEFRELLKKRTFYQTLNAQSITVDEIAATIDQWRHSNRIFENDITERFSLGDDSDGFSYWKLIWDILK